MESFSSTTTASSSAAIHPIFCGAPAVVVVGACRSGHAIRPFNRITDPDNAETLSSNTTHKRKASGGTAASHRVNRKVTMNLDDEGSTDSNKTDDYKPNIAERPATMNLDDEGSTDSNKTDDYKPNIAEHPATTSDGEGGDTEPEEDFDLAYASTKAMGDVDCEAP